MNSLLRVLLWTSALAIVASPSAFGRQTSVPVGALRSGGHAILFRHATVRVTQDRQPLDLADCASQHPLSDQGRIDARNIGAAFRVLNVPVGRVLASPYCRTLETAQLAFGRAEPFIALVHPAYVPVAGVPPPPPMAQRIETIRRLLVSPDTGANTILVTHGQVIIAVVGIDIAEGEMAVYRPDGSGDPHLVARVLPGDWVAVAPGSR